MPALVDEPLRLSSETRRVRWIALGVVWLIVAIIAIADTVVTRDYVKMLEDSATLPGTGLVMQRVLPASFADAQQWTRLAIEHEGGWQVRYTMLDNAPAGREVHWNSGFVHLIQLAGAIRASFTGELAPQATERALAWFNLPILLFVVVAFSVWVARRAGAIAGALLAFGMLGQRLFYDAFAPNNVDHHGLLSAAAFGVVLGAVFMHAGWRRVDEDRRSARDATLLSAICGGIGMWVSAASTIPTIALTGVAGCVAAMVDESGSDRDFFDADLWRLWGRVGASISFLAYLVEYAPSHLGMRLEANHPLYALAWLAGGELVAQLGESKNRGIRAPLWRTMLAIIAALAPAVVILIGGSRVFLPGDHELAVVHSFIDEFNSLGAFVRRFGFKYLAQYLLSFVLMVPAIFIFQRGQPVRRPLVLASVVVVGSVVLGCIQVRWWQAADAVELALLLVGVAAIHHRVSRRATNLAIGLLSAVFLEQSAWRVGVLRFSVEHGAVTPADAMSPLFHDVAATLRATQPTGDITLLSSPDASIGVGYYGGFKLIGTFYWENRDGLAAAARMFSAESEEDAQRQLVAHGVTHVAVFSAANFLEPYLLASRGTTSNDTLEKTFGFRLLSAQDPPQWLRAIPFRARAFGPKTSVRLYQYAPQQTAFESLWASAVARAATGDTAAESKFDRALALRPTSEHAQLLSQGARDVYGFGAHALALHLYKRAAALQSDPQVTLAIAWILATSEDDAIRDGNLAVSLLQPIVRAFGERPGVLDTYAAALAEAGRFDEASRTEAQAMDDAARRGDDAARERAQIRLSTYRSGRPWRQ